MIEIIKDGITKGNIKITYSNTCSKCFCQYKFVKFTCIIMLKIILMILETGKTTFKFTNFLQFILPFTRTSFFTFLSNILINN